MSCKLSWLFFWTLILCPQITSAQTSSPDGGEQQIEVEDFSLRMPSTWSRFPESGTLLTVISPEPPPGVTFRDNIRIKKYPNAGSHGLDEIVAAQKNSLGSEGFELHGSGMLDGTNPPIAWMAVAETKPSDGKDLTKIDYMMIHGENLFALHAMCPTNQVASSRQAFDAIARSIQFKGPAASTPSATPKSNDSRRPSDYENGRKVGQYTVWAMIAAVVIWALKSAVGRLRK